MENQDEIKIRALPRTSEKKDSGKTSPPKVASKRWIIYVSLTAVGLLAGGLLVKLNPPSAGAKEKKSGQSEMASTGFNINETVSRHMQEAETRHEIMKRTAEMENAPFKKGIQDLSDEDIATLPDDKRGYGVQMDTDENVDRLLEDLNLDSQSNAMDSATSPADRITAKLANRKWMNEMERAQRIAFVRNFIRSAYERGYEVEIDANLVVVGVKKINRDKVLDINQVIDRLAKGQ